MNIDVPDAGSPEKRQRSFEEILKSIQPKLDKIPEESRIAPLPPSEEVFEAVKNYFVKAGLPVTGTPATVVSVAGEFVERGKLAVGRAGKLRGLPVFAFLYPEKKRFNVYGIFARDGIDARRLGQALYWGILSDIPTDVAQSKPLTIDEFWSINAFNKTELVDAPVFECLKRKLERERDEAIESHVSSAEAEVRELRKRKTSEPNVVVHLQGDISEGESEVRDSHNRAENWKLAALLSGGVALLLIVMQAIEYLF